MYILTRLLWLAGFAVVLISTGYWTGRALHLPGSRGAAARLTLTSGLGLLVWTLLLFAAATAGTYRATFLRPLFVVVTLAGLVSGCLVLWNQRGLLSPSRHSHRSLAESLPAIALALGLAGTMLLLAVHAMRPDLARDEAVYHLTVPRLYLEHGGFFRIPWNVYSNWPLGAELLFGWALALDGRTVAKLLHYGAGLLGAVACYAAARAPVVANRVADSASQHNPDQADSHLFAVLAAALFLAHPIVLYEVRVAYIDLFLALFVATAFLLLEQILETPAPSRRQLALAASFAGAPAFFKLSGFFPALAFAIVYTIVYAGHRASHRDPRGSEARPRIRDSLCTATLIGGSGLLFLLPWMIKNAILVGNPLYPFAYSVFGGPDWNIQLGDLLATWQGGIGMGRSALDLLLLPIRVLTQSDFGYARFDGALQRAWIVLLPLGLIGARWDKRARRAFAVGGLLFVAWAATSQQTRLLIPALPLFAVGIAGGLRQIAARLVARAPKMLGRRAAVATGGWVLVAGALAMSTSAAWPYLRQTTQLTADLWRHGRALEENVIHPVYRFIDTLPAEARILSIGNNQGFFVDRTFFADSFFEAPQSRFLLGDEETAMRRYLRDLKITHVLLDTRAITTVSSTLGGLLGDPAITEVVYRSPDGRFEVRRFSAKL